MKTIRKCLFIFNLNLFSGPVEIDTSGASSHQLSNEAQDLSHSLTQQAIPNGEGTLLSTVATSMSEALPAHLSSTRVSTNLSCLDGSDSILIENQHCLPSSSQLEEGQSNLMDQNTIASNQAASFLSYAQEHQGGSIGIGNYSFLYYQFSFCYIIVRRRNIE